ncbi:MAG: O-antigen ligase family protein [Planctomycetota bacterium]|jgi:O-antigen ligase
MEPLPTLEAHHHVRDFGKVGSVVMAVISLVLGGLIGYIVYLDGLEGLRNTYDNPLVALFPTFHYLNTALVLGGVAGIVALMVFVYRFWSLDRMILFLTGLLLVADVIPGLSALLGAFLLLKLFRGVQATGDAYWPLPPVGLMVLLILIAYSAVFLQYDRPIAPLSSFLPRIPYILLPLFLTIGINTTKALETVVDFFILAAMLSLGVELIQGLVSGATGVSFTFTYARGEPLEKFDAPWGPTTRLTGLMSHPNRYANVASTVAIVALWLGLQPKEMITRKRRTMMLVVFFLLAIGVLFSWSRSGWLSAGIVGMLVPFFRWPHLSPIFLIVLGTIGYIGYTTGAIEATYQYVYDLNAGSADFRWHVDNIGAQAFFENPILGLGAGGTTEFFNAYDLEVHNAPVQILSDLGLVGAAAFLALFGTLLFNTLTVLRSREADPRLRQLTLALSIAGLVTFIQSFVEVFLWLKFLWTYIALFGCIYVTHRESLKRRDRLPATTNLPITS